MMIRPILALAFLAAIPSVAVAQVPPPMGPPAAMGPSRTSARTSHGITVSGNGSTQVNATSARISLQISTADNRLSLTKTSLQPIADALVKAGADPASIALPINFSAPGFFSNAAVGATIPNPTIEMMKSGIVTVGSAIASMPNIRLNGADVVLRADDCSAAQTKARQIAIDDAHAKARAIAKQLGVNLGEVVDVNVNDQSANQIGCASQYYVGANGAQFNQMYGQPPNDRDYVTIAVRSYVSITYAIK